MTMDQELASLFSDLSTHDLQPSTRAALARLESLCTALLIQIEPEEPTTEELTEIGTRRIGTRCVFCGAGWADDLDWACQACREAKRNRRRRARLIRLGLA